jgi:signal transduction histidine kinase
MARTGAPIRSTILAAFATLVVLGGASVLLGLVQTRRLDVAFRDHEAEVGIHDRVARFRSSLLSLSLSAHEAVLSHDTDAGRKLQERREALREDAVRCDECHARSGAHVRVARLLARADDEARTLPPARPAADTAGARQPIDRYDSAMMSLHDALSKMEKRYAAQVERQQGIRAEILGRAARPLWLFLLGAVLIASATALWITRNVGTPIRRLIEAARRIGGGDQAYRIEPPRDPDLAELTSQFHEMTTKVAQRAHEAARGRLLERVLSSQEEERKRIARELHDQVGQSLAALLLRLRPEAALANGAPGPEDIVRELIDRVHRMAWDLRPSILSDHGLEAALARYVQEESAARPTPIDYQYVCGAGVPRRFAESLELVVYRVAQEAIHNALVHSGASRVSVVVLRERAQVTLLVEDDGRGFDVEAVRASAERCLGLVGMEERVALVGGGLTIASSPGAGCSVRVRVPDPTSTTARDEACPSAS